MTEFQAMREGVAFWESYRMLMAEAVFMGTVAAYAAIALVRWLFKQAANWGLPSWRRK